MRRTVVIYEQFFACQSITICKYTNILTLCSLYTILTYFLSAFSFAIRRVSELQRKMKNFSKRYRYVESY